MRRRTSFVLLLAIMTSISLSASALAIYISYRTAFAEERKWLADVASDQARLIEAINASTKDHDAALSILDAVHGTDKAHDASREFVVARREDNRIVFLYGHGQRAARKMPKSLPFSNGWGEPARRGLRGQTGTMIGLDYSGVRVLAAYVPVKTLDWTVVVKTDLAELQAPYRKAARLVAGLTIALVLLGGVLFVVMTKPLIRDLQESEERHRRIVETAEEGIWIIDAQNRTEYVNQRMATMLGYGVNEMLGRPALDFLYEADREEARRVLAELQRGIRRQQDVRLRRKDGSAAWTILSTAPIFGRDDKFLGTLAMVTNITQRKRGEEELRESERRFRAIFEQAPLGVAVLDSHSGQFTRINQKYCAIAGYTEEEMLERTFQDITHPEDLQADLDNMKLLLAGAIESFQMEKRYIRKDHSIVWVNLTVVPLWWGEETPRHHLAMVEDITERKRTEERLHLQGAALQAAANSILITDREGTILWANPAFTRTTGFTAEEVRGQNPRFLKSDQHDAAFYEHLWKTILSGDVWHGEIVNRRKDGSLYTEEMSIAPVRQANGEIRHFVAIKQDITERKRGEEALRQSEEKYRAFFERDLAGHYISTPDGRLLDCNRAFARMFGFASPEDAQAANIVSLYRHPEARESFLRQLKEREHLEHFEKEYRRRDGKPLYAIENAVGLFDQRGELVEIHGFLLDETEHRNVERQLRQAQKMEAVGRLAGGVAHDFNNLLGIIVGYSELLAEHADPADPRYRQANEIHKAAVRGAALTRQLLAFSRRQILQPTVLDLNAVVKEVDRMLRRLIGEDIELITVLDPALGHVRADEGQIEQVILNLAVNSRDAMQKGGQLMIQTANVELDELYVRQHGAVKPGPYVMLAMSDTGTGMDEGTRAHLFEPFFTTKEPGKGTGLGLATVYGIVNQSGGNIWVYSEPGHGTTFKVYLPRTDEPVGEKEAVPSQARGGSETILLAEDATPLRDVTREFLERSGYTVLEAQNVEEALQLARRHQGAIPLLITDVVMPGMSGAELAARLTSLRPEMRVLYISGYTDEAIAQHGVLAPGVAFLQKPYTRDALARKVREVLDAAKLRGPASAPAR